MDILYVNDYIGLIYLKFIRYLVQIYIWRKSRKYLNSVIIRCINKSKYSKRHFPIAFKLYHDSNGSRVSLSMEFQNILHV